MTIDELREKWEKDPNSRVFLQLAEEYRKSNRFDDAIRVCQDGLKKHPGYSTARITLARALLAARRLDDAKREFETVLAAVPDSLLANRYLGDLYYEEGRVQDSLKRYRVVQMLSPSDEEVASRIQRLESGSAAPVTAPPSAPPPPPSPLPAAARPTARDLMPRPAPAVAVAAPAPEPVDDGGFMDLKIDESVILNADMIAAALGAAGAAAAAGSPTPAPPPPAGAPPVIAPRVAEGATAARPSATGESGTADEVGEMGLDDFSEFSSPTVMLTAADLARIPGVADAPADAQAAPVPTAPLPPVVVSAAPTAAAQRAQKYGISFSAEPAGAARAGSGASASATPAPLPQAPSVAPAPAVSAVPVRPAAAAAGAGVASTPMPLAPEDSGEMGGMDDFSEFAAPTVMMNVSDLLKAAGVAPDEPVATSVAEVPATSAAPAFESEPPATVPTGGDALSAEAPFAEMQGEQAVSPWLSEEGFVAPSFDHDAMSAPGFDLPADSGLLPEPRSEEPAPPVFGTQLIPVADFEAMRDKYIASVSGAAIASEARDVFAGEGGSADPLPSGVADTPSFEVPDEASPIEDDGPFAESSPFAEPPPLTAEPVPAAAVVPETGVASAVTSKTLGQLYVQQGQLEKALEIFQRLHAGDPGDVDVERRLREVQARLAPAAVGVGPSADPATAAATAAEVAERPGPELAPADGGDGLEDRKKKMQKLSSWLASLKKS